VKKLLDKFRHDNRGATLIWVSLAMVAFLSMTALNIDGGYAYAHRCRTRPMLPP